MKTSRSTAIWIALTGMLAVFVLLVLYPVWVARSLREDLRQVRGGAFPLDELRAWAEGNGGTVTCTDGRCYATVTIGNRLLSILNLAPATEFVASITTDGGKLVQTGLVLSDLDYSSARKGATTQLLVDFSGAGALGPRTDRPHLGQEPIGKPPAVSYVVTPSSSAREVALAYKIDLWCLARIGGCLPAEQAPAVWALRTKER